MLTCLLIVELFSETTLLIVLLCCCYMMMSVDSVDRVFKAKNLYGIVNDATVAI